MPLKRKVENEPNTGASVRRSTRSTGAHNEPSGVVSPARKRHRDSDPQDEIENSQSLRTPCKQRTFGRKGAKVTDAQTREKVLELPFDDLDLVSFNDGVESPKNKHRRVVLDSVEVSVTRRANANLCIDQRASVTADPTRTPVRSKKIQRETDHVPDSDTCEPGPEIVDGSPKCSPALLREYLESQKKAILNALRNPRLQEARISNYDQDSMPSTNSVALQQLSELLGGSIERGEGNSCLIIGPAGSGKSMIFERALSMYEDNAPIIIRLNGHVQHTDRLAIREIARQVVEQTGSKKFESIDIDDDDNPFDDSNTDQFKGTLPPPSHLPSLIAALPTLSRPVVVLLDAFNVFTEQPRQALLYCLLDTVQSCRAGLSSHGGLAVIGLTSRVDVVNLLEKRVKSRFSHRISRTSGPRGLEDWLEILRQCLCATIKDSRESRSSKWRTVWDHNANMFLQDRAVRDILKDLFGISKDVRGLQRILTNAVIRLSESSPFLTVHGLRRALESQCSRSHSSLLMNLDYPSLSLCIAAQHARTAGHDTFTFEMLHELFATQVRTSSAAPVMLGGGSIGMVNVGRRVLLGAFEELIKAKIFLQAAAHTAGVGKEFVKYRCAAEREDVKVVVDRIGQTNLKKWFSKA